VSVFQRTETSFRSKMDRQLGHSQLQDSSKALPFSEATCDPILCVVLNPYSGTIALCRSWVADRVNGPHLHRLHTAICEAAVQLVPERTRVSSMAIQLVWADVPMCVACAAACASQVQACGAPAYVLSCGGLLDGSTWGMTAIVTVFCFARVASTNARATTAKAGSMSVAMGVPKCCATASR
jgi:hypothetical protein